MKSLFLYVIFYAIFIASARKVYDVEEEALKLYGEDFNSVLLRFRKSPDYLKILQDKVTGMLEELSYMMIQVQDYCTTEMNDKILLTLGVTSSTISPSSLRSKIQRQYPFYSPMHVRMRKVEDNHGTHQPPVTRLDHYPKIHHALSIANLNHFKAVGFEYAGNAIHTVIKHMASDDAPARSTQQPYYEAEPNTKSTAESPHDHQVKPSSDVDITHPHIPELTTQPSAAAAAPDLLRHSYRN